MDSGSNEFIISEHYVNSGSDKTILIEESPEFLSRASDIQQICTERGITILLHFTRVEKLQGILQEGLLSRRVIEEYGQKVPFNDGKRLDRHKAAICLSISFPNYELFSKFQYKYSSGNRSKWVVLLIEAKVLWELDCAFCQENAASNAVRCIPLEERKIPDALKGMFVDVCSDTKGNVYRW